MPHYGIKSTAGHHHLRVVCAPKFNRTEGQSKISGNKNPSSSEKNQKNCSRKRTYYLTTSLIVKSLYRLSTISMNMGCVENERIFPVLS